MPQFLARRPRLKSALKEWVPPLALASVIIFGLHPGVTADTAPTAIQLGTYLQTHQLQLTTTVTNGYQQIYYAYNGQQVQLTTNAYNHTYAQASGPYVVWEGMLSGGGQIFLLNVLTGAETQLTFGGTNSQPSLFGNQVVWRLWDGQHWQIAYYNGLQTTQLTSGATSSVRGSTNGRQVIYAKQMSADNWQAMAFDIATKQTTILQQGNEANTAYPAFGTDGTITTAFSPF